MSTTDEYGPIDRSSPRKESAFVRSADNMVMLALSRYAIMLMVLVVLPVGGYAGVRIMNSLDKVSDHQEKLDLNFTTLNQQVLTIVSDQMKNSKNIADRIESGEKITNDRINAQGDWLRQLASKVEDLTKYVYQKVR